MKMKFLPLYIAVTLFCLFACVDDMIETDDPRQAFLGNWIASESCTRFDYEVEIKAAADSDTKVLLYNFALAGLEYPPAFGFVSSSVVDIPEQIVGDNWKVSGSGTLQTSGKILWNYNLEIAGDESSCQADYEKP